MVLLEFWGLGRGQEGERGAFLTIMLVILKSFLSPLWPYAVLHELLLKGVSGRAWPYFI